MVSRVIYCLCCLLNLALGSSVSVFPLQRTVIVAEKPEDINGRQNLFFSLVLTNSMEQSPSWEARQSSASQEIPHILWSPKIHYRIHKSPPPVLIHSHKKRTLTSLFHFSKIHLKNILPSTPRSSKWSVSLMNPHQNPMYNSPVSICATCNTFSLVFKR